MTWRPRPRRPPQSLGYRTRDARSPEDQLAAPDQAIDLYLPLALLGAGTLIQVVHALWQTRGPLGNSLAALQSIGVGLLLWPAIMFVGLLIAAKFRGIKLGSIYIAGLKLAAIAIAPGALGILLTPLAGIIPIFGGLALLGVEFMVYFALIGTMFKLDESDTWYCVCVFFVLNVAVYLAARWLL